MTKYFYIIIALCAIVSVPLCYNNIISRPAREADNIGECYTLANGYYKDEGVRTLEVRKLMDSINKCDRVLHEGYTML